MSVAGPRGGSVDAPIETASCSWAAPTGPRLPAAAAVARTCGPPRPRARRGARSSWSLRGHFGANSPVREALRTEDALRESAVEVGISKVRQASPEGRRRPPPGPPPSWCRTGQARGAHDAPPGLGSTGEFSAEVRMEPRFRRRRARRGPRDAGGASSWPGPRAAGPAHGSRRAPYQLRRGIRPGSRRSAPER